MLVALGTALFVLVPQQAGLSNADLSRVIQGVVAGVGFLGAGAVIKQTQSGQVHGAGDHGPNPSAEIALQIAGRQLGLLAGAAP